MRIFIPVILCITAFAVTLVQPKKDARRLEVLFFGAPTAAHPGHDPVTRYRVIKRNLGTDGINFTYSEDPAQVFSPETLKHYDAVMMYGNWDQNGVLPASQLKALTDYIESGHGFLPIHCASACYGGSAEFVKLVGGRFKSHETGVFEPKNTTVKHPIIDQLPQFSAWDETYTHDQQGDDRIILQTRDAEPWTWVRNQGKGRVFYTASGHDHRVWDLPQFHELLKRAVYWSVGPEAYGKVKALELPQLEQEEVKLPGYLKRELITKAQKPLSPEQSIKLAQVPPGFEISLFASEPDIVNPINVAWDHKGRAFVLQTVDYPNNLHENKMGNDKITICEDTDNDGRADKFTVFADKLSIPSSLCFVGTQLLCTNASEILILEDKDGDDKAEVRRSIIQGFGTGDTHAGVSNLRYGLDNWIYGTVGYSGFNGVVGGKKISFNSGLFRFKADASELEFLQSTTNNTWGLGFTSDFDILGSTANGNPSWVYTFAKERYDAFGISQPKTPAADNNPIFNPSSADIRQVDQFERYTAGAGHSFYTAKRFPAEYQDKIAFVTEPTGKLVGQFTVKAEGASFKSTQLYNNLYNSADAWSGPVAAETGPDGAVWISDWYNLIIQHNPTPNEQNSGLAAVNGKGNAYETPVRDKQHGRVYRIYPIGSANDSNPKLDLSKVNSLISALSHDNLFWRTTAQSLLIQRGKNDVATELKALVAKQETAAAHAFSVLTALQSIDDSTLTMALISPNRALRRLAAQYAATHAPAALTASSGAPDLGAKSPRELAEKLVALSYGAPTEKIAATIYQLGTEQAKEIFADAVLADAWQMAARRNASFVLALADANQVKKPKQPEPENVLPNADFSDVSNGMPVGWSLRFYAGNRNDVKLSSSDQGRNGSKALQITAPSPADVGAGMEVKVEPHSRYRFSAWIRTENVVKTGGMGAMINAHAKPNFSTGIEGTKDWQQISFEFETKDEKTVLLHCLFGGYGGSKGTAFWDDLSLVKIASGGNDPTSAFDSLRTWFAGQGQSQQVVVKKNKIDTAVHQRGAATFALTCTACHQPDGEGTPAVFPPLNGSEWLINDPELPIKIVLKGLQGPVTVKGATINGVMPPHNDLDDQKIADVLTYARQSWTNDASAITADQVKAVREKVKDQVAPWTAKELNKN